MTFPRPQLLVYTLMLVPVVYGAAKLVAAPASSASERASGIAAAVLIPLPVLVFWIYILAAWQRALLAAMKGDLQRSASTILKAYQHAATETSHQTHIACRHQQESGKAALGLLGDVQENPTLIIRDKMPGEEDFERLSDDGSDDEAPRIKALLQAEGGDPKLPEGRPVRPARFGPAALPLPESLSEGMGH